MTAIELIIKLQKFDPNKEVVLDFTKPGMDFFRLMGINDISEVEAEGEEYIMLSGMGYEEEHEHIIN